MARRSLLICALLVSCAQAEPEAPAPEVTPAQTLSGEEAIHHVPVLEQRGVGCVPYAAAAVAQFHGVAIDPLALLRALPVTPRGIAYADVVAALRERDLRVDIFHPTLEELRRYPQPLLVGLSNDLRADHALVVEGYAGGRYHVMDPANPGLRQMDQQTLERGFSASGRVAMRISRPE